MNEYIEREELTIEFMYADADVVEDYGDGECEWGFSRKRIQEVINSVPSADVAPVRHGRWLLITAGYRNFGWCCSECGRSVSINCDEELMQSKLEKEYPFCHCGARMDLEVTNGS